jgi:hypothetical protein
MGLLYWVGKKGEETNMGLFYTFLGKVKNKMDKFPMYPFSPSFSFSGGGGGNRDFEGRGEKEDSTPLVTSETKEYLFRVLNQCYETRMRLYSNIWNTLAVIMVLGVVVGLLYLCYYVRPTPEQQKKRRLRTQKMVLAKMREMKEMNQYTQPNGITFLPVFQNKGY